MEAGSATNHLFFALQYASAGLPVFPVFEARRNGSCACGNKRCPNPGKHPRVKWRDEATTDKKKIETWWKKWPRASIGGVGGEFFCFDVDPKSEGYESLAALIEEHGALPDTAVALTGEYKGERGTHYWFKTPKGKTVGTRAGIRDGLDLRGEGGYAVLPPSRHYSGTEYEWATPFEDIVEPPKWLLELLPEASTNRMSLDWEPKGTPVSAEVNAFIEAGGVDPGAQRFMLTRAARSLLGNGKEPLEVVDALWQGLLKCDWDADKKEWSYDDCVVVVKSLLQNPPPPWEDDSDYNFTDWGNAERLVSYMDGNLRYVPEWGKWYIWDGSGRWIESLGEEVNIAYKEMLRGLAEDALKMSDHERRSALIKHALRSESGGKTEAAVKLARSERGVMLKQKELNADPWLLNVKNGVVDLRTGSLVPATREMLMTKQATCEYNPDAKSDLWNKVITEALVDQDLLEFIQKAFGYALTGSTEEQVFFYFYGLPATGKSTILEAFRGVIGNYAEVADASTFMIRENNGGPREDLARLSNARFVLAPEVEKDSRLAEAAVSRLTGQDVITARFLHQQSFSFTPKFKLFFAANHKPRVSGDQNSGIWRRIKIVPFLHKVEKADKSIPFRLASQEHREAILAWAVEGAIKWQQDRKKHFGLTVPGSVDAAVREYQVESDPVAEFISECFTIDEDALVPKHTCYEAYEMWCETSGRRQRMTSQTLSRRLKEAGYSDKMARVDRGENPTRCWVGLKLRPLGYRMKGT